MVLRTFFRVFVFVVALFSLNGGGSSYAGSQASDKTQSENTEYDVTLYGQKFTIDTSLVNPKEDDQDVGLEWHDIRHKIPEVLPGVRDGKEVWDVPEIIQILADMRSRYEGLAYDAQRALAESVEKQGHIEVTLSGLSLQDNSDVYKIVREELAYAEKTARIEHIEAYIHDWFRTPSWEVDEKGVPKPAWVSFTSRYNQGLEKEGKPLLNTAAFINPFRWYEYYVAVSYLDTMLRFSPEYLNYQKR